MPRPVDIRRFSQDHVEFCGRCEHLLHRDWWRCGEMRFVDCYANDLCAIMRECPLGKWRRS